MCREMKSWTGAPNEKPKENAMSKKVADVNVNILPGCNFNSWLKENRRKRRSEKEIKGQREKRYRRLRRWLRREKRFR